MPKKILAIKLRSLGDTVLMAAPIAELRRAFPDAEIHALASEAWLPLLEAHPAIDRLIPYRRHSESLSRLKALTRLASRLRGEKYDIVVNFHASPSSALLSWATGARVRSIHFHGHAAPNRHSTVKVPGKGILKPATERDMDAVRALGIEVPLGQLPGVFLRPHELAGADRRLEAWGLKAPILAIGVGASRPTKMWPIERFAEVAQTWLARTQGSVLVLAGPGEADKLEEFRGAFPLGFEGAQARVHTEGGLSLRELAAVLKKAQVFLCNDSGPKHVAIALGTKTVTLIGPEHPFEWHPYSRSQHPYFFIESLECRRDAQRGMPPWCALEECTVEKHRCMQMILSQEVAVACLKAGGIAR